MNKNKRKILYALRFLPDKFYLGIYYFLKFRKICRFQNPKTFNEKLQWLKLHDRNPEYGKMVDKYAAKDYVASVIGEEYLLPTLGVWDCFEEIDFDALPDKFVLKTTHDSGGVVLCPDKAGLDKKAAEEKLTESLKTQYFYVGREWPYKSVRPRILAEAFLENADGSGLVDYKFFCFNGKAKAILVCTERDTPTGLKCNWYDRDWKPLPFEREYPRSQREIPKPQELEKMIALAEKLAADIPFVRVDFYDCDQKIYFGELTFFPGNGMQPFRPAEWDRIMGDWLELPKEGK